MSTAAAVPAVPAVPPVPLPVPVAAPVPAARVAAAMGSFASEVGALSAFRMESCIHCGICAESCHYYLATDDPQYTPIWKIEPFKQAYKRESSTFAPVIRALGLKRKVSAGQLEQWQHLLYDSCNLCGRCSLICPMGIDIAALIEQARHAMFDAGLAPAELYEKARRQVRLGQPEDSAEPYAEQLLAIGRQYGAPINLDMAEAEVMLCVPRTDIENYPAAVAALARVMVHLGVSHTFRSDALVAENYGYFSGGKDLQRAISRRLIDQAIACRARVLLVPECGHAYTALRWEAADLYGKALPFEVRAVSEYLGDALAAGKLRLRPVAADSNSITFQDPCQLARKGGVTAAPRALLKAMQVTVKEMDNHGDFAFCCGGGGGVIDIARAAPLRHRTLEVKLREIDATGAKTLMTSCSDCRHTFDDARRHFEWDKAPQSLLELIASQLQTGGGQP
jgi:Fe-S oxidoreductase